MSNDQLFLQIVSAVITIVLALISAYVVPWLNTKIGKTKIETLNYYLELAVKCANQIYTEDQWREKKQYVTEYIVGVVNDKLSLTLTKQDIDILIEGMVNHVKKEN